MGVQTIQICQCSEQAECLCEIIIRLRVGGGGGGGGKEHHNILLNEILYLTGLKEYLVILTTSFYDMNEKIYTHKKSLILPKFQLISILRLQVMHDCVQWHCSIDCCVKLSLVNETSCKKLLSFHRELISA